MSKVIWSRNVSINRQVGDLNNQSITNRWNTHNIRFIEMFGKRNQSLQYVSMPFIMILVKLKNQLFFGQLRIWVNIQLVIPMTMRLYSTKCLVIILYCMIMLIINGIGIASMICPQHVTKV